MGCEEFERDFRIALSEIAELERCNAELREKLSRALDNAHDTLRLMDLREQGEADVDGRRTGGRTGEFVCEMTAVDAETWETDVREPVVRCRDCAHWARGYCHKHAYDVTNEYGDEFTEGAFPMDEAGFCSLGERRADDDR